MILILVWLFVVLLLSIIPTGGLQTGFSFPADKIIHFIIYGITAIIFFRALRLRMILIKAMVLSISFASLYGFAMELLQSELPWRGCSYLDEVANMSGAVFFSVIYALMDYRRKKIKS